MIIAYYKFLQDFNADVTLNQMHNRYKCIEYSASEKGLLPFQNILGQIHIEIIDCNNEYIANTDGLEFVLVTSNQLTFYATYIERIDELEYYYTYPDLTSCIYNDTKYDFTNDGYLLIFNYKEKQIDIIAFEECKGIMGCTHTLYTQGFYDEELWLLKNNNEND